MTKINVSSVINDSLVESSVNPLKQKGGIMKKDNKAQAILDQMHQEWLKENGLREAKVPGFRHLKTYEYDGK